MKKEGSREALIVVGLELIRSTGYTATGINQIVDTAAARSFYDQRLQRFIENRQRLKSSRRFFLNP